MSLITEMEMANKFEILLNNKDGIEQFPYFNAVFRELNCKQGIPDFITISGESTEVFQNNIYSSDIASLDSSSLIISILKPKSPRTLKYITERTSLSDVTVKRVLKELITNDVVKENDKGAFILNPIWQLPKVELWAFELKLKDWKRALFQCLQYKAFANRVMLVMPEDKENIILKNIETLRNYQIGVMLFNAENLTYRLLLKPAKVNPSSKNHNIYAVGKIATEINTMK